MKLLALPLLWIIPFVAHAQDVAPNSAQTSDRIPYVLAPMDRILIRAPHVEKINGRTFQIQPDGFVTLPSVGCVRAAGLGVSSLEKTLAVRLKLKPKTSGDPEIAVYVTASSNK